MLIIDIDDVAIAELQMSDYLIEHGRLKESLVHCLEARQHFEEIGSQYEVAQTYLNEALVYTGLKQHDKAVTALSEARHLFEAESNAVWVATTDLEMARTLYRQGKFKMHFTLHKPAKRHSANGNSL